MLILKQSAPIKVLAIVRLVSVLALLIMMALLVNALYALTAAVMRAFASHKPSSLVKPVKCTALLGMPIWKQVAFAILAEEDLTALYTNAHLDLMFSRDMEMLKVVIALVVVSATTAAASAIASTVIMVQNANTKLFSVKKTQNKDRKNNSYMNGLPLSLNLTFEKRNLYYFLLITSKR